MMTDEHVTSNVETTQDMSTPGQEMDLNARKWAMFCHLGGLAAYVGFGIAGVVVPLILWQLKKNEIPFVDDQGKEATNFQITMMIYGMIAFVLVFAFIGFLLLPVVGVIHLVFMIIAAIKANEGEHYRYPDFVCFRIIK